MVKIATDAEITRAAKAAFDELQRPLNATSCHIFLGGSHRQPTDVPWRRLRSEALLSKNLRAGFSNGFFEGDDDPDRLVHFDYEELPQSYVAWLRVSDIPDVATWLATLPASTTTRTIGSDSSFLADARYQAARLQFKQREIVAFRRRNQATLAKRNSILALRSMGENEFRPVNGTILSIETPTDFIHTGEFIFINNIDAFEKMTNLREITLKQARLAVEKISTLPHITVNNLDVLPAFLEGNLRRARRLAAASSRDMLADHKPRLLRALAVQLNLPIEIKITSSGAEVDLDGKNAAQMKAFIDLMTEYYVKGATTRRLFRAPVKQLV